MNCEALLVPKRFGDGTGQITFPAGNDYMTEGMQEEISIKKMRRSAGTLFEP